MDLTRRWPEDQLIHHGEFAASQQSESFAEEMMSFSACMESSDEPVRHYDYDV